MLTINLKKIYSHIQDVMYKDDASQGITRKYTSTIGYRIC